MAAAAAIAMPTGDERSGGAAEGSYKIMEGKKVGSKIFDLNRPGNQTV